MNIILNGILEFFKKLLWIDWLNCIIAFSLQAALITALLWPFRRLLEKVTNVQLLVRALASILTILTFMWYASAFYDLRLWYRCIGVNVEPLLRISIPVRIKSQIAEIPSAGSVDWLMVCTILWLLIPSCYRLFTSKQRRKKPENLYHYVMKNRQICPTRILSLFDKLNCEYGPIWDNEIDVVYVEGLPSPCTYRHGKYTIALDRIDYTDAELEYILRHELAHITSKHIRLSETLDTLCIFHWFNPIFRPIRSWCRHLSEFAADAKVLSQKHATSDERLSYARLLVQLSSEEHLAGAALYLSAGAEFVRQRVKAILNPQRKLLTIPVTILLIVMMLHTTLLIAPGRTEYSVHEALASLGNDNDYVRRGIDSLIRDTYTTEYETPLGLVELERNKGRIVGLLGECSPENASEYIGMWIDEISAYLGEPEYRFVSDAETDPSTAALLSQLGAFQSRTFAAWPVTLSAQAVEDLWDEPPEQVYIQLSAVDYTTEIAYSIRLRSKDGLDFN